MASIENEIKKKWLRQYLHLLAEIKEDQERLLSLKCKWPKVTASYTGMPRGGNASSAVEVAAVKMADLDDYINQKIARAEGLLLELLTSIEDVPDPVCRRLLLLRYANGCTWAQVASWLNYDEFYTRGRLHGKALALLKMPQNATNKMI